MSRPVRSAPVKDKVARKDDGSRGDIPLPSDSGCKHQGTGSLADQDIIQQGDQDRAKSRPQTKKYVPPALRGTVKSTDQTEVHRAQDSEQTAAQRQIRKLFNRVAASNLMGIASEISSLFGSMPRYLVIETIVQALMQVSLYHCELLIEGAYAHVRAIKWCRIACRLVFDSCRHWKRDHEQLTSLQL